MKKILALILALSMVFILAACGGGKTQQKDTVTVSFDTDGGNTVETQTVEKGGAVVKPETPKKSGFIFDKWTLNGNEYEFGTAVNENIVLKATWIDPNNGNNGGNNSPSGPLFKAKTLVELHIRKGPGTDYEIAGKLPYGSTIEVFETKEAGGYTWNRINDSEWVADDGTWLEKINEGGDPGNNSSTSSDAHPTDLYFVNNWYWVQEKCYGDPEWIVKPETLKDKVTFTSSDTSIATVDNKGIVYGVKPGNVTITIKCGDLSDTLPLEIRSASPYITLDTDYLSFDFTPEYATPHPFTISYHNGADPNSPVSYTLHSSYGNDAGTDYVYGDTFYADHVGRYIFTATTQEGYSASCTIEVFGTELHAMTGAVVLWQTQGKPSSFYLVEDSYFTNGNYYSNIVTTQCTLINSTDLTYTYDDEYNAYLNNAAAGSDHYFRFYDSLNNVYSMLYHWYW